MEPEAQEPEAQEPLGSIEVYVAFDEEGKPEVGLLLRDCNLVEFPPEDLSPGCSLTPTQARALARALCYTADEIDLNDGTLNGSGR